MLFSNEKGCTSDACYNMGEPQNVKWRKPHGKEHTL